MQEDWNIILSIVNSPDAALIGQQKVFNTSPISIGRGDDNDLVISDPSVSRKHAMIRITNDYTRVFITDSSTYGTTVNGESVPKGPGSGFTLSDGCIITIGSTELRFELKLKLSVQSTFIGQNMDRSFLDGPPPETADAEPQDISEPEQEAPRPAHPKQSQTAVSPVYIAGIIICLGLLVYIFFFAS